MAIYPDDLLIFYETFLIFHCADLFLDRRERVGTAQIVPVVLISWLGNWFLNSAGLGNTKIAIALLIDVALLHLCYRGVLTGKLFFLCIFYIFNLGTQAVIILIYPSIFHMEGDRILETRSACVSIYVLTMLCMTAAVFLIERLRCVRRISLSSAQWAYLMIFPLTSIASLILFFPLDRIAADDEQLTTLIGFSSMLLFFNAAAGAFYHSYATASMRKAHLDQAVLQIRRQREYYEHVLQAQERQRYIIHDILKMLELIDSMLADRRIRSARRQIEKITGRIALASPARYTGNRDIDAILDGKIRKKDCICWRVDGRLPADLPFDILDLCLLLGNALDNAVEAAVNSTDGKKRITVHIAFTGHIFVAEISNPIPITQPQKKKKNKPLPGGNGIAIMNDICERYDGQFRLVREGDRFIASILLQSGRRTHLKLNKDGRC